MVEDIIPGTEELIDNSSERTPCVLVLDGSGSMGGDPIKQLNEGLRALEQELKDDPVASARVQLLVIRAGDWDDVEVLRDWTDAMNFEAPEVKASGSTPIGTAMDFALQKIEEQKQLYDANGIPSKRPWVFLISDGEPTDHGWEDAADRCVDAEHNNKVVVFPIGTASANFDKLDRFSSKPPKQLDGLKFKELFVWLSRSVSSASKAAPGQAVQLDATDGWATAET